MADEMAPFLNEAWAASTPSRPHLFSRAWTSDYVARVHVTRLSPHRPRISPRRPKQTRWMIKSGVERRRLAGKASPHARQGANCRDFFHNHTRAVARSAAAANFYVHRFRGEGRFLISPRREKMPVEGRVCAGCGSKRCTIGKKPVSVRSISRGASLLTRWTSGRER